MYVGELKVETLGTGEDVECIGDFSYHLKDPCLGYQHSTRSSIQVAAVLGLKDVIHILHVRTSPAKGYKPLHLGKVHMGSDDQRIRCVREVKGWAICNDGLEAFFLYHKYPNPVPRSKPLTLWVKTV